MHTAHVYDAGSARFEKPRVPVSSPYRAPQALRSTEAFTARVAELEGTADQLRKESKEAQAEV